MDSPETVPAEVIEDARWFDDHLEEIRADHEGEYIAVVEKKIVAVGKTLDEVLELVDGLKVTGKIARKAFIAVANDTRAVFSMGGFIQV
jgi:hypothetical protein